MNIELIGNAEIVMSNPESKHNYFAWPSIAKLQNGKIAVVSSGYRLEHICPFGKAVISYSDDGGETFSLPAPIIDTVLDDRDAGITTFGKSGVVITSFNNTVDFQRNACEPDEPYYNYINSYLDSITSDEEKKALGSTFRISNDCGTSFGDIYHSPITSPHGPVELSDGTLLWIGRMYSYYPDYSEEKGYVASYKINLDGTMEFVGKIDNLEDDKVVLCEPHTIQLDDGTLLCHIRAEGGSDTDYFTTYQSKSYDLGKTWTFPQKILSDRGGAPAHLLKHSSGAIISTYGYREKPYGIRAMLSLDNGDSWDIDKTIYTNNVSDDLGYPATIELDDGSLLTVFYAHPDKNSPAVILKQKWRIKK